MQLSIYLTKLVKLYARGDISIRTILMDQEFDKVVEKMTTININTMDAWEHVRKIEHGILFVKERCYGTWDIMPIEHIPKSFVNHLVYFCVLWINSFPTVQGISKILSPRKIVLKQFLIFERDANKFLLVLCLSITETSKTLLLDRVTGSTLYLIFAGLGWEESGDTTYQKVGYARAPAGRK